MKRVRKGGERERERERGEEELNVEEGATLRLPSKLKLRNPLESSIRIEEWI